MSQNKDKIRIVKGKKYIFTNGRWVNASPTVELDPHDPDYSWDWDLKNRR